MKKYWGASEEYKISHPEIAAFYAKFDIAQKGKGRKKNNKQEDAFDAQKDIKKVTISDKTLHHTRMLNAYEAEYLRFIASKQPGVYFYICTFPGHWIIMRAEMIVK